MCISGITPGPYSADPQTFNHLLSPLVDKLIVLDAGVIIPTYQFSNGRFVQVKLLAVSGDILATKKVVGYTSHSATKFCTFCHAEQANIPLLQLLRKQVKEETLSLKKESKDAETSTAQDVVLKQSGV
ncbi:hypothetical protein VP01_1660g14 [Puccinia sorghi]|uniref:Uncharacterized protein n=1 Tax=Puccinia sorghi TaxID=27349 RepID=A0A0L6VGW1_9BASI|nr:hypothetical protein VP01_1660g14 [Puccinia sorghi]